MRVNQFNNSAFTQNSQSRTSRSSNMQSFAGVMSNISGQQQLSQVMPQQSSAMQVSGISGTQSNFPAMMPAQMPQMPSGEMPSGEMPASAPSESDGNMPQPPSGNFSGMNGMNSFNASRFAMNIR